MKGITVLSLFNGVGGAAMAFSELRVPIKKLYSSEIDKFANKATQLLFPDTIQLGDITQWDTWEDEQGVNFSEIDILMAGFPCQAWSMAGKQKGDNDPRGALVHDLLDIWSYTKTLNPNLRIMFENVAMKKEFMDYINNLFGVEPVMINAALVTAQNRKRNYWMNWEVNQPEDLGILLKDIIETDVVDRDKSYCIDANYHKGGNPKNYFQKSRRQLAFSSEKAMNDLRDCELRENPPATSALCHHVATATDIKANESNKRIYADSGKAPTLTTMGGGHREPKVLVNYVNSNERVKAITENERGYRPHQNDASKSGISELGRIMKPGAKTDTITTTHAPKLALNDDISNLKYRKLTPRECMRLQGFPDWCIDKLLESGISNSQLYKMTGNGWAIPVIVHNLKSLLDTGWIK